MERSSADGVLLAAIRMAMAISVRAADEIGNVSAVQLRALTALRETPGANLVQLSQAVQVTVSTASRLVDRLVAAGLADRRPSPQTRREIVISLTDAGRTTLDHYDQLRLAVLRACLGRLSRRRQGSVVAALETLLDAGRTPPPLGTPEPSAGAMAG